MEVTPVVNEGFVFFTNVNNLVNGLSLKEIQDIYTDKITNWNQVGGDNVKIIYNGSRNKKEEYKGKISEAYNYIFMVKTNNDENKSFSYSDILTKTVEIYFDNKKM